MDPNSYEARVFTLMTGAYAAGFAASIYGSKLSELAKSINVGNIDISAVHIPNLAISVLDVEGIMADTGQEEFKLKMKDLASELICKNHELAILTINPWMVDGVYALFDECGLPKPDLEGMFVIVGENKQLGMPFVIDVPKDGHVSDIKRTLFHADNTNVIVFGPKQKDSPTEEELDICERIIKLALFTIAAHHSVKTGLEEGQPTNDVDILAAVTDGDRFATNIRVPEYAEIVQTGDTLGIVRRPVSTN